MDSTGGAEGDDGDVVAGGGAGEGAAAERVAAEGAAASGGSTGVEGVGADDAGVQGVADEDAADEFVGFVLPTGMPPTRTISDPWDNWNNIRRYSKSSVLSLCAK